MNFIFISPQFPHTYWNFCDRLRRNGVNVLGIGDSPYEGLEDHLKKYPYQLSGGQKQRGAACRALITDPEILFADEPTGALDSRAGRDLLECLKTVNDRGQATILMVTHDPFCASYARDVCMLSDGLITCRISRGADRKEFYDRITDVQTSMGGDFSCQ